MLGAFAEFETNLRRERQLQGIQQAKAKGVYKGRKPSIDVAKVKALRAGGKGPAAIARELKMARSSRLSGAWGCGGARGWALPLS
jgi:DNA invertase Pin-like site-specific DNA recombinase